MKVGCLYTGGSMIGCVEQLEAMLNIYGDITIDELLDIMAEQRREVRELSGGNE